MISAFGVDHGEISKGLSPKNVATLGRVASTYRTTGDAGKAMRDLNYAQARLAVRSPMTNAEDIGPIKSEMGRLTRTTRTTRDANRRKAFGTGVNKP